MKTLQNIIQAKETLTEVAILLKNGKTMYICFRENSICRFNPNTGVEQTRYFYFDGAKMFNLAVTYLKKQ